MILLYITIILLVAYGFLILFYRQGWKQASLFHTSSEPAEFSVSVIIPARNEEKNIGPLLKTLEQQSYPRHLTEVIVVDDDSTDQTADIAKKFPFVKLIHLEARKINSYKKKALEAGIAMATGDIVVTTDADCKVPDRWLQSLADFKKEKNAAFIAAPVKLEFENNLLQVFQALDFLALQGITVAAVHKKFHTLCNGANLAYEKKVFQEVNGFSGIDAIASGDDLLLMEKISKQYPHRVFYLLSADAIVSTKAVTTWKEFLQQRIRWASKSAYYKNAGIVMVLSLVYLLNLSLLLLLFTGIFNLFLLAGFAVLMIIKTGIEYFFLYPVARFFKQESLMKFFPFFQPLHIVYTVLAGALGLFTDFEWKGRRVK